MHGILGFVMWVSLFVNWTFFCCQVDCSEEAELCQSFGVSDFKISRQPSSMRKLQLMLG